MAAWICCLRWCFNASGFSTGHVPMKDLPAVKLDTLHMGHDVVIVKSGKRICGTGAALANAPIVQNKAYFEAKLQSGGTWGVGVATRKCDLNTVPLGTTSESWVIRQDGKLYHNDEVVGKLTEDLQEGDIIAMTYDHIDLRIYVNGKVSEVSFRGIRGTIYPVLYVDEGSVLDVVFNKFYNEPPDGFEEIMIEKSLL